MHVDTLQGSLPVVGMTLLKDMVVTSPAVVAVEEITRRLVEEQCQLKLALYQKQTDL